MRCGSLFTTRRWLHRFGTDFQLTATSRKVTGHALNGLVSDARAPSSGRFERGRTRRLAKPYPTRYCYCPSPTANHLPNQLFPTNASARAGWFAVGSASVGSHQRLRPIEAEAYRDTYPDTDSLELVMNGQSKELLWLHSPNAPSYFEYKITTPNDVTVAMQDGRVMVSDVAGHHLEAVAPWLLDGHGRKYAAHAINWELRPTSEAHVQILTLRLQATGLAYPLLVDPG